MDVRILVVVGAIIAIHGQPVPDTSSNNPNFVPGVFISADTLKDLQEKAQQNQSGNQPITNPIGDRTSSNQSDQLEQLKSNAYRSNSGLNDGQNQQPMVANQPILGNPQPMLQPALANQQPLPNQPLLIPNQQLIPQPQTLPNIQQPMMYQQPNQPTILVSQPPGYSQQPILVGQQPNNQLYLSQPPNQPMLLANGQIGQNGQPFIGPNGQPFVGPNGNQYLVQRPINGYQNVPQNPGTMYAMVPANTNVGNGNAYLVPVQQIPQSNQMYTVSNG